MSDWLARFTTWVLGGRPMTRVEFRFRDMLNGRCVYLWRDAYGRLWLAHTSTSWFRVRALYGPGYCTKIETPHV